MTENDFKGHTSSGFLCVKVSSLKHFRYNRADRTAIVLLRTYAIWDNDKRVGVGLLVFLVMCAAGAGYFVQLFVDSLACESYHSFR